MTSWATQTAARVFSVVGIELFCACIQKSMKYCSPVAWVLLIEDVIPLPRYCWTDSRRVEMSHLGHLLTVVACKLKNHWWCIHTNIYMSKYLELDSNCWLLFKHAAVAMQIMPHSRDTDYRHAWCIHEYTHIDKYLELDSSCWLLLKHAAVPVPCAECYTA